MIYDATPEEIQVATDWHSGQGSMFYAVSSTGGLSRGTMRPMGESEPMTDDEWSYSLVCDLGNELRQTIHEAVRQGESEDEQVMIAWREKIDNLEDELATRLPTE